MAQINNRQKNDINTILLKPDKAGLKKAAKAIKNGALVVFPTETVFGLGANAYCEEAVKKIFIAKGRPADNPLIVHVDNFARVAEFCESVPESAYILSKKFMPGPLTLVLKKKEGVISDIVTCGLKTIAVRVPSHKQALELLSLTGVPVAAPSANISGSVSPTTYNHCLLDLNKKVDYIISGSACSVGLESTVLDLSEEAPTILRKGAVTKEDIEEALGYKILAGKEALKGERVKSPGMKYRHYSPSTRLVLVDSLEGHCLKNAAILGMGKKNLENFISLGDTTAKAAKNLYAALRRADSLKKEKIVVIKLKKEGIGEAIMDRLEKAEKQNE